MNSYKSVNALVHLELQHKNTRNEYFHEKTLQHLFFLEKERRCALQAGIYPQHTRWHLLRNLQKQALFEKKIQAPVLFFAQGIHPWWAHQNTTQKMRTLEQELHFCHALGECGLDKNAHADFTTQKTIFAQQLQLAADLNLPVLAHIVSWPEIAVQLISKSNAIGMVHGFTGSLETQQQFLKQGWYISFGHRLHFSKKAQKAAALTPASRLLLESDESGTRDQFATTAAFLAQLRNVSIAEILHSTTQNARLLFQL